MNLGKVGVTGQIVCIVPYQKEDACRLRVRQKLQKVVVGNQVQEGMAKQSVILNK